MRRAAGRHAGTGPYVEEDVKDSRDAGGDDGHPEYDLQPGAHAPEGRLPRREVYGQIEAHLRPARSIAPAASKRLPSVGFDHPPHNRQAQSVTRSARRPSASYVATDKWFKGFLRKTGRETGSAIAHDDSKTCALSRRAEYDGHMRRVAVSACVHEQVMHRSTEQGGIDGGRQFRDVRS